MAEAAKRSKLDNDIEICGEKDYKLDKFLNWLNKEGVEISEKVYIAKHGSCAQYGLIAKCDIAEEECLFTIPMSAVLWQKNSAISHVIDREKEILKNESGWVPLLLSLLHEYTNPNSRWRPYLDLVPDFAQLDHPMFWNREDMIRELQGTGIIQEVERDLFKMRREFDTVVLPFLKKYPTYFGPLAETFEFYKKMVAFVMAYCFTSPANTKLQKDGDAKKADEDIPTLSPLKPPIMVPLADILNHVAKNNAHLKFKKDCLEMFSLRPITAGEEIYNTYGELSNAELLHMYGFAEPYPNNHNDTVEISMDILLNEYQKGIGNSGNALLEQKLKFLRDMDLIIAGSQIVIGQEGVLTEEELYHILKVLHMDESTFEEHRKKEGWSDYDDDDDDDNEEDEEDLSNKALGSLPESWKTLLRSIVACQLTKYSGNSEDDDKRLQEILKNPRAIYSIGARRQKWALFVRYGQKKLLENFLKYLN